MDGLVVIPAYNEAESLPAVLEKLAVDLAGQPLLFIDDGSTDRTAAILSEAGVPHLRHPANLGYKGTVLTGIHYALQAEVDFVVFFDADGQHRTEDLKEVLRTFETGEYDLVVGSRFHEGERAPFTARIVGNKILSWVARLYSGTQVTDATCGLKLISRSYMRLATELPTEDLHAELIVGLARRGARIAEVKIIVPARTAGTSMYHFSKALLYPAKTLLCLIAGFLSPSRATE